MKNAEIRSSAKAKGIKMWEVAEALKIYDSAFSRKLRHELPPQERDKILEIIDDLARKKAEVC